MGLTNRFAVRCITKQGKIPGLLLSYTSGEDKWQLRIGKNLADLFRNIRSSSEALYLWIDAICINQFDDAEKSTQVQDMANIYKDAEQVVG